MNQSHYRKIELCNYCAVIDCSPLIFVYEYMWISIIDDLSIDFCIPPVTSYLFLQETHDYDICLFPESTWGFNSWLSKTLEKLILCQGRGCNEDWKRRNRLRGVNSTYLHLDFSAPSFWIEPKPWCYIIEAGGSRCKGFKAYFATSIIFFVWQPALINYSKKVLYGTWSTETFRRNVSTCEVQVQVSNKELNQMNKYFLSTTLCRSHVGLWWKSHRYIIHSSGLRGALNLS